MARKTHCGSDEVASSCVSEGNGGVATWPVILVDSSLTAIALRRRRFLCDDSSMVSMQIVGISTQAFTFLKASSFWIVGGKNRYPSPVHQGVCHCCVVIVFCQPLQTLNLAPAKSLRLKVPVGTSGNLRMLYINAIFFSSFIYNTPRSPYHNSAAQLFILFRFL